MITYQRETVDSWFKDAIPLIYAHWQELGLDTDLKGDIDIPKLRMMEQAGIWLTITVRNDGDLIGYCIGSIVPHLHYRTSGHVYINDMYYIKPEFRKGTGAKMLAYLETAVREAKAIKMYMSCKVHRDQSKLFMLMGYRMSDFTFTKRID